MERGKDYAWMCELCYATTNENILPDEWDLFFGAAICPECRERLKEVDGGILNVRLGCYATKSDPRR